MINRIKTLISNKTLICTCSVIAGLVALYCSVLRVDAAGPVVPQSSVGLLNLTPTPQIMTHRLTQEGTYYNQSSSPMSTGSVIGTVRGEYTFSSADDPRNVASCGEMVGSNVIIGSFGSIASYAGGMDYLEMGCDATWGTCNGVMRSQPPRWLVNPNLYDYQCRQIPSVVNWRAFDTNQDR
jgi:hypothetical protein